MLRAAAWIVSAALHGALLLLLLEARGEESFESGQGGGLFNVETSIAVEGFEKLGEDRATAEPVETAPAQIQEVAAAEPAKEVPPAPPEVPLAETLDDAEPLRSPDGPEQDVIRAAEAETAQEEPPRPREVAALDQPETAAAATEERRAAPKQTGGDPSVSSAYLGRLRAHLGRKTVNPGSRMTGTVVVRFTVDASGRVLSREIAQSSGHLVLDNAALASLERAAPFPPFPDGMTREPMIVSAPFRFVTL